MRLPPLSSNIILRAAGMHNVKLNAVAEGIASTAFPVRKYKTGTNNFCENVFVASVFEVS